MLNFFIQNSPLKTNLAFVLVISVIFLSGGWVLLYPKPAQAVWPVTDATRIVQETLNTIWNKIKWAYDKIAAAYHSAADWITAKLGLSDKARDMIAQAKRIAGLIIMHQVLNMLTNQIIKWIQGGGTPQFVSDWKGFLKDAADKSAGLFIDKYLGMGYLCEPFDMEIKIALLEVEDFETRVECSISDIVENIEDFYNDFSRGGWKGWLELTKPQNNFYGGYLLAQEEKENRADKAREAALNEAASSGGFLSIKRCVKGYVGGSTEKCSDKESCKSLEEEYPESFVCDKKIVVTPGSVLSDITSKAINQPVRMLENQIADMADSMGTLGPYIIAIGNALINRVIHEGLAYVLTIGPDPDDNVPPPPPPPGTDIPDVDETPAQVVQDQLNVAVLIEQQKILKENLEIHLLVQQQSNLSVMQSMETIQYDILDTLKSILAVKNCSLPNWARSRTINTTIKGNTKTETVLITASGVGTVLVEKTTVTTIKKGEPVVIITYQIIEMSAQITPQIANMESDIIETEQWIADTASAIASNNGYLKTMNDYLEFYEKTLQPPTKEEQIAIDQKKEAMAIAKEIAISDSQIAAKSSDEEFTDINVDTQKVSVGAVQEASNLELARGMSEEYHEAGTLYAKKKSLKETLDEAASRLSKCLNPSD